MNNQKQKTTFTNAFGGHSKQYQQARPTYPSALFEWILSQVSKPEKDIEVWDVGTGNGQAAIGFSPRVKHIYASDPSENQILEAQKRSNITYDIANCGEAKLPDLSVDLVSAATAYHWFDHPRFFEEVHRVLRPGGVVALWGYGKTVVPGGMEIQNMISDWSNKTLGPFWDARVVKNYSDIYAASMPFPTIENPPFLMSMHWSRKNMSNFIKSWSAYNAYLAAHGTDPFLEIESEFEQLWSSKEIRTVEMELIIRVLRKEG